MNQPVPILRATQLEDINRYQLHGARLPQQPPVVIVARPGSNHNDPLPPDLAEAIDTGQGQPEINYARHAIPQIHHSIEASNDRVIPVYDWHDQFNIGIIRVIEEPLIDSRGQSGAQVGAALSRLRRYPLPDNVPGPINAINVAANT